MQRKKISTGTNNAAAVLELDDDEQLIETVTTTKAIGRQRRPKPAEIEPEPIIGEVEPDDDDDETEIERTPSYSDTSLAALLYGDGDEPLESQFCTVMIRRNPDSMNDKFLTPCGALTSLPPLRNIELTAERIDIEERVRTEFGGGHYFFQIHFGNQLRSSWKATLSDDPAAVRAAKAERLGLTQPPPVVVTAPAEPPPDPMAGFIASLQQTKQLKDLLFGDTEARMQAEIDRLRIEAEAAKNAAPAEPMSEKLRLLEMALATTKPDVTERVLNSVFPAEDEGRSLWADLASMALENKETIIGLVGSLFGGGAPAAPPSIADMMRQPAPAALPERKPVFNRQKAEPEPAAVADPAPAEMPPPAESEPIDGRDLTKGDETAIDAEITNEVKDAKSKRKRNAAA